MATRKKSTQNEEETKKSASKKTVSPKDAPPSSKKDQELTDKLPKDLSSKGQKAKTSRGKKTLKASTKSIEGTEVAKAEETIENSPKAKGEQSSLPLPEKAAEGTEHAPVQPPTSPESAPSSSESEEVKSAPKRLPTVPLKPKATDGQDRPLNPPEMPATSALPIVPLRDCVVFPGMVIPLNIGRSKSLEALNEASKMGNLLLLVAQKDPSVDDPSPLDLNDVGTLGAVVQTMRLKDGTAKILVEGRFRVRLTSSDIQNGAIFGRYVKLADFPLSPVRSEALARTLRTAFSGYLRIDHHIPPELGASLTTIASPSRICDTIAANLNVKTLVRQSLLETLDIPERTERICKIIEGEIQMAQVERDLKSRVRKQMEKSQREYYLNEKMQAIQKELGEQDEFKSEMDELAEKLKTLPLSDEARDKGVRELKKLKQLSPMSPESGIVRNYLDWIVDLPWAKTTAEDIDLKKSEDVLNEDHFGLKKVKERILEHLAVQALSKSLKGPILCFVGPPGVGKTSLGKSIAKACGRSFIRLSLGGVRDEAEIRGHRRTYVGAMPGKIIQSFKKAGTGDPVFLLDEIDKMSSDFRGDPAAALLEVLDPEQNATFTDHYLDLEYDLSKAMFICTANTLEGIPLPLRDRMEIIRLSGYTDPEKRSIARRYLIPKAKRECGLDNVSVRITPAALRRIIQGYTKESGVRSLEREVAKICRKLATAILKGEVDPNKEVTIELSDVTRCLGKRKFRHGEMEKADQVGLVTGLAWTQLGGELLVTEATLMPGKGKVTLTGQLGKVMQESAQAAMSYVRSRAKRFGISQEAFEQLDLHIHVPEGAIPKDGPSAGITMATTMISAYTQIPVHRDVAMTGEITLRGRVLPIGGLKEKAMAAHRGGIRTVIIPKDNKKDIVDIPKKVRESIQIIPVEHLDEVLKVALCLKDPESFIQGPDVMEAEVKKSPKGKKKKLTQES